MGKRKRRASCLVMFVIYDHPSDYPASFVVRKWLVRDQAEPTPCTLHDTLEDARESLPDGLTCLSRSPDDDKAVVETWL